MAHPEQPSGGVEDARGVEGGDQRQVVTGRVGEARHGAARVGRRYVRDGEHRSGGSDGDDHIARSRADAEGRRHVVARARPQPGSDVTPGPRSCRRPPTGPRTRGARRRARARPRAGHDGSRRHAQRSNPCPRHRPGRSPARPAPAPARRQVSQSCGRQTAATRSAASGSFSRNQASLVTVNEASGTDPTAFAHVCAPPSSIDEPLTGLCGPGVVPQQGGSDHLAGCRRGRPSRAAVRRRRRRRRHRARRPPRRPTRCAASPTPGSA